MKALVTGGAGFIGSHLADAMLERGFDVRVLDSLETRVHPKGRPSYLSREIEFMHGDVRDRSALERALEGVEVVFHQAAYQDYMPDYAKFFDVNVVGTALLFEIVRNKRLSVQKVIVASSQSVYGEGQYQCAVHGLILPQARPTEQLDRSDWNIRCPSCGESLESVSLVEAHPNPAGAYGISKLSQEIATLRLGRLLGIHTAALRYSIVQGPRQSFYNAYSGICRIFTRAFQSGKAPLIFEDGLQLRDYVHISDIVAANLLVLDDPRADGQAFNVGTGRPTTVREYAAILQKKMNAPLAAEVSGTYRVGDVRHTVSSSAKFEALGWKAEKGLSEIFDDYLTWLDSVPDSVDYITSALEQMKHVGIVRSTNSRKGEAVAV